MTPLGMRIIGTVVLVVAACAVMVYAAAASSTIRPAEPPSAARKQQKPRRRLGKVAPRASRPFAPTLSDSSRDVRATRSESIIKVRFEAVLDAGERSIRRQMRIESAASWMPSGTIAVVPPTSGPGTDVLGVIIAAGGDTYGPLGYALCKRLRRIGCMHPVRLFYNGDAERPDSAQQRLLDAIPGVRTVSLHDAWPDLRVKGFACKVLAVAAGLREFGKVLVLDADVVMYGDICGVVESAGALRMNALFFQDLVDNIVGEHLLPASTWSAFGLTAPAGERQQDSSCMYIDARSEQARRGVTFALYCAMHHADVYGAMWGDKDTWRIGMRLANCEYAMAPVPPGGVGVIRNGTFYGKEFMQHDPFLAEAGMPNGMGWKPLPLYTNGAKLASRDPPTHTLDAAEWNFMCDAVENSDTDNTLVLESGRMRRLPLWAAAAHREQREHMEEYAAVS